MSEKREWLSQVPQVSNISAELMQLLDGDTSKRHSAARTELRERLGIGWKSTGEFVLVSKRIVRQLNLHPVDGPVTTRAVLGISADEQAAIDAAIGKARDTVSSMLRASVQRREPVSDIVAQYSIAPLGAELEQTLSNNLSAEIVAALGSERADIFLQHGWTDLRNGLAPDGQEPVTLSIRRSAAEAEPALVYETRQGNRVSTSPIRYANYPSRWFLIIFPGGWQTVAQDAGFELPRNFQTAR